MKRSIIPVCVAALALLGACSPESEPEAVTSAAKDAAPKSSTQKAPAPAPQPAAEAEDPTAGMARAVGNGKPGAAVQIKYEFSGKPAVGAPTELEVALIPTAGVDSMEAAFSGMEGVTLSDGLSASFTQVEPGKPYMHKLSLVADRTGVFYVTVSVTTHIGGTSLGRTFSIPFVVGTPAAQHKPQPARDATGQPIEPMPAQEKRR